MPGGRQRGLGGQRQADGGDGLAYRPSGQVGTVVHVAAEGRYLGYILIADEVKPDAKEAIAA